MVNPLERSAYYRSLPEFRLKKEIPNELIYETFSPYGIYGYMLIFVGLLSSYLHLTWEFFFMMYLWFFFMLPINILFHSIKEWDFRNNMDTKTWISWISLKSISFFIPPFVGIFIETILHFPITTQKDVIDYWETIGIVYSLGFVYFMSIILTISKRNIVRHVRPDPRSIIIQVIFVVVLLVLTLLTEVIQKRFILFNF